MSQQSLSPGQRRLVLGMQRAIYWLSKHWLALVNLVVFVFVALPFAAPTFMELGWRRPARVIYTVYKPLCHQLSFRSWFLFGEEPVYPLAEYQERFGLSDAGWAEIFSDARGFVGNETVGYKVAFCQRDIAIYGALLLGGLAYALLRRRGVPTMPFWLFILIGVVPIGLDGGSQFLSLILPIFPARESVWLLRTLTGALFGLSLAWLAYPYVQEGMDETQVTLALRHGWDDFGPAQKPSDPTTRDQVVQLLRDQDLIDEPDD